MFILILQFLFQFTYADVQFEVIGPCLEKPFIKQELTAGTLSNVGELTIHALKKSNYEFIGTSEKIESINKSPVGQDALEVINRKEMRAYGWCFFVNGQQPEVYPHEVSLTPQVKSVQWVFTYASYKDGVWLSMCEPSWVLKPKFLCK